MKISLKVLFLFAALAGCTRDKKDTLQDRPNIIIIMVDDMGYADIGCYGAEIPTPNIDRLAEDGIRFSQFYNVSRCCPTRATLLTGLFPHQTGIGDMTENPGGNPFEEWGTPGYTGFLNKNCVTMAELLKDAGYRTYMTGKWHLGYHARERWPLQRGFDKFYGIISGACSYFWPNGNRGLTLMNEHLSPPDSNTYYTTDAFTDYAIKFIEEQENDDPFFLYLAYNAPHWPLHAKEEDIQKFIGKYMKGWDVLREERYRKQYELGLLEKDWGLSARDPRVRPWEEVDEAQKVLLDYRMAVYAAQIYAVDNNIGKLIGSLKKLDKLDNTLILFLSDNGASNEPKEFGSSPQSYINKVDFWGAVSYGRGWANASNTPFYQYKCSNYEGGMSTPLIAHWPDQIKGQKGKITHSKAYLIDLMPTVLEVGGAEYPETYHEGEEIYPLDGISLFPVFMTGNGNEHEYMFWEHINNCAVRKGDWKAVKRLKNETWHLFRIDEDRIESTDLAEEYPEIVQELNDKWYEWAYSHFVLPKKIGEPSKYSNKKK